MVAASQLSVVVQLCSTAEQAQAVLHACVCCLVGALLLKPLYPKFHEVYGAIQQLVQHPPGRVLS